MTRERIVEIIDAAQVKGDLNRHQYTKLISAVSIAVNESLDEAAEKSTLKISQLDRVISEKQLAWLDEDGVHYEVSKDSILNLKVK